MQILPALSICKGAGHARACQGRQLLNGQHVDTNRPVCPLCGQAALVLGNLDTRALPGHCIGEEDHVPLVPAQGCPEAGDGGQLDSDCLRFSNLLFTQRLDPIQFSLVTGQFAHIPVGSNPIEQFVQRGSSQLPLDDGLS